MAEEAALEAMFEEAASGEMAEQEATPQGRGRGGRNAPRTTQGRGRDRGNADAALVA